MFQEMIRQIQRAETISYTGKIENIVGMSIEASGGRAAVGDICQIYNGDAGGQVMAEVVGFKNDHILLMPYSDMSGISAGNFVRNTGRRLSLRMGPFLKGRVINALGQPIDGKGPFQGGTLFCVENNHYINPMTRPPIRERMEFGVKAIDSMLTIGKGQRIGIFAGSGVGKSTLMGMIAKNVKADINVIALVGERGREVLEFMEKDLGPEGAAQPLFDRTEHMPVKVGEADTLDATEPDFAPRLAKAITEAEQEGARHVELKLAPEHLGRLSVELTQGKDGVLHIVFHAENEQAMKLLQEHSATLVSMLHGSHSGEIQVEVPRPQQGEQPWQQPEQQPGQQHGRNPQEQGRQRQSTEDFLQQLRLGLLGVEAE